ncbi:ATP-binding protein [Hymenobacter humi]|uniref:histidine kinase n=1 Tax=Hymenobacter humi TaxID=1411620 RepID=A0ABW2U592_9BACT
MFNLVSNAIKYRAPDRVPQVRIRAWPEASGVMLEVEDNGLGLDTANEHKLFGMFQRFHDHVEGSGIGLYMVKKMVENAGGALPCAPGWALAPRFWFTLPADTRYPVPCFRHILPPATPCKSLPA